MKVLFLRSWFYIDLFYIDFVINLIKKCLFIEAYVFIDIHYLSIKKYFESYYRLTLMMQYYYKSFRNV